MFQETLNTSSYSSAFTIHASPRPIFQVCLTLKPLGVEPQIKFIHFIFTFIVAYVFLQDKKVFILWDQNGSNQFMMMMVSLSAIKRNEKEN